MLSQQEPYSCHSPVRQVAVPGQRPFSALPEDAARCFATAVVLPQFRSLTRPGPPEEKSSLVGGWGGRGLRFGSAGTSFLACLFSVLPGPLNESLQDQVISVPVAQVGRSGCCRPCRQEADSFSWAPLCSSPGDLGKAYRVKVLIAPRGEEGARRGRNGSEVERSVASRKQSDAS